MTYDIGRFGMMAFAAFLVLACVDTTPITDIDVDAGTAFDGGDTAPDCEQCLRTDDFAAGCGHIFNDCLADERCSTFMDCAAERGCFMPAAPEARLSCVAPCSEEVGIQSDADPLVATIVAVHVCSITKCRDRCVAQ